MNSQIHKMLMKKAGALLARRTYGRIELKKKLTGMADNAQIDSLLNHLEQLNLLNDEDYAYNFALRRIRQQGWSVARVKKDLSLRQIDLAAVESALERVLREIGSQADTIATYLQTRYAKKPVPRDPKGIRNLILQLRNRGFDEEQIFQALRALIPAAAMQRFETGE